MLVLMMAVVSRCAVASLCPTDADLKRALYRWTEAALYKHYVPPSTGEIVLMSPTLPKAIRDVHCGEAEMGKPDRVRCSFTVSYPQSVAYQIATLRWADDSWEIIESQAVHRKLGQTLP